jgi:hypothetical protein
VHRAYCRGKLLFLLTITRSRSCWLRYQGVLVQTWKGLKLEMNLGPDDTYFQYTTVSHDSVLDTDAHYRRVDWMDDVDVHALWPRVRFALGAL